MPGVDHDPMRGDLSLRSAGGVSATPATWALRIGCGALALGAAVAGWSALRPLPEPMVEGSSIEAPALGAAAESPALEARDALLARLHEEGNIFAPDRADWTQVASRSPGATEGAANQGAPDSSSAAKEKRRTPAAVAASAIAGEPIPFDAIPVEDNPPAAVAKSLKDLRLRGVYRTAAGLVVLIGDIRQKDRNHAEAWRVGDVFGDDEWTLVAIDEIGKRVILSRAGMNVQLAMYDVPAGAAKVAVRKPAPPLVRPPNPSVVVHTRTPEQFRADLIAAGVSEAEIDELIALAEADEPAPVASKPADVSGGLPEAPPAMVELLKMMSSDEGMPKRESPFRNRNRERRPQREESPPK